MEAPGDLYNSHNISQIHTANTFKLTIIKPLPTTMDIIALVGPLIGNLIQTRFADTIFGRFRRISHIAQNFCVYILRKSWPNFNCRYYYPLGPDGAINSDAAVIVLL